MLSHISTWHGDLELFASLEKDVWKNGKAKGLVSKRGLKRHSQWVVKHLALSLAENCRGSDYA